MTNFSTDGRARFWNETYNGVPCPVKLKWKHDNKKGVSALFKGMGTPLASAALVNAICFGAYAQSQRVRQITMRFLDRGASGGGGGGRCLAEIAAYYIERNR